jgi:NAD(P)-dependent dehydrogenase (short-subunit alcohol dehydrogenase family)
LKILVTGAAGFIGMQVAKLLLERGDSVVGLDNINDYYDPALKKARLDILAKYLGFRFVKLDVAARAEMSKLFATEKVSARRSSGGPGRRSLFDREPACLCGQQPGGFRQRAGRMPA